MSNIKVLEQLVVEATQHVRDARNALLAAQKALDEARINEAQGEGHKWAGMLVKRKVTQRGSYGFGSWKAADKLPDRVVTQSGFVTLCEGVLNYRNHRPEPGEWFVLSRSASTAYSLDPGKADGVTLTEWELG